jgi:hypothetical protein
MVPLATSKRVAVSQEGRPVEGRQLPSMLKGDKPANVTAGNLDYDGRLKRPIRESWQGRR